MLWRIFDSQIRVGRTFTIDRHRSQPLVVAAGGNTNRGRHIFLFSCIVKDPSVY